VECEKLLEIARKVEHLTTDHAAFLDDRGFEKLEREYKEQVQFLLSLSL